MSEVLSTRSEGGPPLSLEVERRKTMRIVHSVEKAVAAFKERVLKKAKTQFPEDIQDFIQFVVDRNQAKRFPRNINEFIVLLGKVRDAAEVVYKKEVELIEAALGTNVAYKEFLESTCAQLKEALDEHVGKYCHSFSAETGTNEVPSVQFYENNITRWRGQIKDAFNLLGDISRSIRDNSSTLELFLNNYATVVHYMTKSMDVFPRLFAAFKDWVTADEAYAKRVQEDIAELKREKMNADNIARRNKMHAGGIRSKVTRSQHHSKKLKERLLRVRDERRQCRRKELLLVDSSSKVEATIRKKKKELDKTLHQLYASDRPINSARENLAQTASGISEEIARLEKRVDRMQLDLRSLKTERMAAQKEFHKMQVLCEKNSKLETDILDDAHDASQDVKDMEEERRIMGEKLMALCRIRAIKLNPNTVKVIFYEGFTPGRKFDSTDDLEDACRIAATDIGKDWPSVYQNLPFSPHRETHKRFQDIDSIQDNGKQMANINNHAAYHCLERWKRLSVDASVKALTRTLRSLKKQELAEKVEKKIVTVN